MTAETTSEALGYTRLSQSSDTSIDRQKDHIREYADTHGFDLVEILNDGERSSGFDSDREEYQRLKDTVSSGDTGALLVNDKRRLARDFDATMRLILDCREEDIEIHTHADGQLDIDDPMSAAVEVLMAASDYESKQGEIDKARESVRERVERGCYHGTVPHGLTFRDDKCHLKRAKGEWEDIQEIIQRRDDGESVVEVADSIGVSTATVSRVHSRGVSWYTDILDEYGL
jgi:DNA invertase Pin-like site-specific DNA recombinase